MTRRKRVPDGTLSLAHSARSNRNHARAPCRSAPSGGFIRDSLVISGMPGGRRTPLRPSPSYHVVLGLGLAAAAFSIVDAVLIKGAAVSGH